MHKRILLIENGIDNVRSLEEKLSAAGYIVDVFESVRAETAFEKNPDRYNIVIADLQSVPDVDLRKLSTLNKDIKTLDVSATEIIFKESEVNAVIRKPIDVNVLIQMVRKLAMPTVTLSNTYCL